MLTRQRHDRTTPALDDCSAGATSAPRRQFIVPIDGSQESWRAVGVAVRLAQRCGARVKLVGVEFDPSDVPSARRQLNDQLSRHGPYDVDVEIDIDIRLAHGSVASELEELVRGDPGSTVVMSTLGRGRSTAIVGSVARDVLARTSSPVVFVGPMVTTGPLGGPVMVTVDRSTRSEAALPAATTWADALQASLWILTVANPRSDRTPADGLDSAYPARIARRLGSGSRRQRVGFEILHHRQPGRAVVEHATHRGAALIVAATRGRRGMTGVVLGSVAAHFVRHATCPVVLVGSGVPPTDACETRREEEYQ